MSRLWLRSCLVVGALAGAIGTIGLGCTPEPPPPKVPVVPTASPSSTAAAQAPTGTPTAAPGPVLPSLHPCVPDFASREMLGCSPAPEPQEYGAVVKAFEALSAAGPRGPKLKPGVVTMRDLDELEQDAVETARGFLCVTGESVSADQRASVGFELGRIYRGASHLEEAAIVLREVVMLAPGEHPEAEYAAPLLVESLELLFRNGRPECMAVLDQTRAGVLKHVCEGPGANEREETCNRVRKNAPGAPGPG